ncbi:MAG: ABC transporter substrate-binding protein [Proteobacteria bacterium]|nr:ABC transporter substrate-binding protein [Pseudomonadota bacterium]
MKFLHFLFLSFLLLFLPESLLSEQLPVTFNDFSGQEITLQQAPQRIVSLGPINTENIYLLGAEDRLIANTSYCVHPEAAKSKEKIGSVMSFSVEKVLSLRPDLVLASNLSPEGPLQKLRDRGIAVVQFHQATSFADICSQFINLGRLLHLEALAIDLVSAAEQKVAAIGENISTLPKPKVFLQVGSQPLAGAIGKSFTHDFITLGGGMNISEAQLSATTNPEKVIAENPDVIIIAIMGNESGLAVQQKKNWQNVSVINAVRDNRVHVINPDLVCSPSPATFAATLTIFARLIHPELDTLKIQ